MADLERPSAALSRRASNGLPVAVLDELARAIAPEDPTFSHSLVPPTSLARQRRVGHLTPEQSDRVAHLARLWFLACRLGGGPIHARIFLHHSHPLLHAKPIDLVMTNAIGLTVVEELLGRVLQGIPM